MNLSLIRLARWVTRGSLRSILQMILAGLRHLGFAHRRFLDCPADRDPLVTPSFQSGASKVARMVKTTGLLRPQLPRRARRRGHRFKAGGRDLQVRPVSRLDHGPQSRQHRRAAGGEREFESLRCRLSLHQRNRRDNSGLTVRRVVPRSRNSKRPLRRQ
jgi:hypothetical protein